MFLYVLIGIIAVPFVAVPLITVALALVATWRWKLSATKSIRPEYFDTALYTGRVSHARFHPAIHAFSYPLFFVCLDLKEYSILFGKNKSSLLWPLTYVVNFLESHHLKNGEGLITNNDETTITKKNSSSQDSGDSNDNIKNINKNEMIGDADNTLHSRIRRLVAERTRGRCRVHSSQRIWLLTHLEYFGYCFNPVSFYYIMKQNDETNVEAIVAEVSNTPWLEMYCYVLHPDSVDIQKVQAGRTKSTRDNWFQSLKTKNPSLHGLDKEEVNDKNDNGNLQQNGKTSTDSSSSFCQEVNWESTNYIFEKKFHVSPFMDMRYIYDWTFWNPTMNKIAVSTTMIKYDNDNDDKSGKGKKHFNAYFEIQKSGDGSNAALTPMSLCRQILSIPYYCIVIQIWIHIEAFWLFWKGVQFIPHPQGTETTASQIIGKIMAPFFALQEWWEAKTPEETKKKVS